MITYHNGIILNAFSTYKLERLIKLALLLLLLLLLLAVVVVDVAVT